jgi:flagellar hook assembly protein FlgD
MDLTFKFETQAIVAALGDVSDGEYRPLTMEGETWDGTVVILGDDCVWIKHKVKEPAPPPVISIDTFGASSTTISLSLSEATEVSMVIYDVQGKRIKTVVNDVLSGGNHRITWNGRDQGGNSVSGGVYFCRVIAGSAEQTVKVVMVQ